MQQLPRRRDGGGERLRRADSAVQHDRCDLRGGCRPLGYRRQRNHPRRGGGCFRHRIPVPGQPELRSAHPWSDEAACMKQVLILAALILSACQARKERLTTNPKIALQNLDGQIEELEKAHARSPEALQFTGTLVGLLATRAQYLGRLSDYDRALALAEEAIHRAPGNASALLMRAGARSSLH